MTRNPFTPTFGVTPPLLVGRDQELAAFRDALEDGPGAPGRSMLLTGARGTGKTVLLNAVEDVAKQAGWLVLNDTARAGVAHQLATVALPVALAQQDPEAVSTHTSGGSVSVAGVGGSVTRERVERYVPEPNFRLRLERLADLLAERGKGVLISLDEVQREAMADMREITQAVQHCFRAERQVAFVAAGLPAAVEDVLNDGVMTFLRRSDRFDLGPLMPQATAQALREPIEAAGRSIAPDALNQAVAASRGYPFAIQAIGYEAWAARRDAATIDAAQMEVALAHAGQRLDRSMLEPALRDISHTDRRFLQAMAVDDGPSRIRDVTARLGVTANYASQYRARLITAGLIEPTDFGQIDFTLPLMRQHLRGPRT
jgi:type II secretory pathway predicted ATPase ExeA